MQKRTKQKELILSALRSNAFHPTSVWIYDEVRKALPHISLATVYRNLKRFVKDGEISALELDGNPGRFDIMPGNHGHFWCDECDRIFNLDEPAAEELNGKLTRETGFEISNYQVVLRGLCLDCRTDHNNGTNHRPKTEPID